jgi:predicted MFS family arabinose efflux permease
VRPRVPPLLRTNEPFRRFWTGQTISLFGDQISLLAIPLLAVLTLHAGAAQMGLLGAVELAPYLLFAMHLGAWADRRRSRRALLIAADLGRAALLLALPIAAALGDLSIGLLYAVSFCVGTLAVVFDVGYQTVFASLVDPGDYLAANSLLVGSRSVSVVGGKSVGGLLVAALTAPVAVLADALSYVASALFVGRAAVPEPPPAERGEGGLADGARFIARTPLLRASLAATATLNIFNAAFWALLVLFATSELGIGAGTLGLALGIGALGSVLGSVLARPLSERIGLGNALILAFVLGPAPLLLVPLAPGSPGLSIALLTVAEFLSGIGIMILDVGLGALQTALIPDALRARVAGAYVFVNWGVRPVGALAGGLLAGAIGLESTMWIAAAGAIAGVLWLLPTPLSGVRGISDGAPDGTPEGLSSYTPG